jgi:hypothetical protein
MFSDYYLQLSYNHHIHKNVTLEQILHGDTEASTIYPENVPDEFITSIISNNNTDYDPICEPLVYERCIPNTDIVLRKLYGFWKRNYIDDTDKSQKTMYGLIMNFAYDYAYNTYISEYCKKRINFIRKTDRGKQDSMWYKTNNGGACPEETAHSLLHSYSEEFRCLTHDFRNKTAKAEQCA